MHRRVQIALPVWMLLACSVAGRADAQSTWTGTDIGQVGVAGSASVSASRIRIDAEGLAIWGTADSGYFVYRSLAANGQITARATSLTAADGGAKGGVMIRQSLAANAMNAALVVTPTNGLAFQQRLTAGGATVRTTLAGAAPVWLRLSRSGTTITAYRSNDGTAWTLIASADVAFQGAVYIGFAVSSNRASTLATAVFDSPALSTTPTVPPRGPVAAWAFDEGAGTTVRDSAGTNHGTLSGATWATGRNGRALSFDGLNDGVSVPDAAALDLSSAATVEAWVRPTTVVGWRSVAAKESSTGSVYQLHASNDAGRPAGSFNTGVESRIGGTTAVALNTWTHVAVTYDGATARLYVNGVQTAARALTGSIVRTTGGFRIGGNAALGDWFAGRIDDLRVYDRALVATEIQTDRNIPVRSMAPSGDTTAPTVAVTSPAAGTTVSGSVALAATATDNVGVASVQFRVNGANVGAADTAAPYTGTWNTASLAGGTYMVSAVATDAAGNQATSAAVSVTVSNTSVTVNARSVSFTSPSHTATTTDGQAVVTSYELEVWTAGSTTTTGTPYRTANMGKPATTSTELTIDQQAFFATLPTNQQFVSTVRAIGPGGSARSDASNIFTMQ